ncbi:AraC family transcriptional regulator [Aquimarina mytili]|uniref:AraC family transcriptional regulator n=1 Tax=Aquimarina mytili TaxID=874423 RepID=A0A936ZVG8_9FLAO|nr:AraC family transcriptional regulator [Aquimarina mytili]MBL0686132.1 AraC family transcriptional regulator [Aquimarina mytili]
MSEIKTYDSISEYFEYFKIRLPQEIDFTIHSLEILQHDALQKSPLFRTNYFAFLLIEKGAGYYTIDDNWFPLKEKSFYFTNPGHTKSFAIDKKWQGHITTFTLDFLKPYVAKPVAEEFSFLLKESIPVMYLPNDFFQELKNIFEILLLDYNRTSAYKKEILASQLITILYKTKALLRTHKAKVELKNRPAEIVQEFNSLLNTHFLDILNKKETYIWNVQKFADKLHIHPNYFSSIIKNETGKTVKQWINTKIISEAKASLHKSTLSITEIAYSLGFLDINSFSRFFKKETGVSPSQFRNP